MMIGGKFGRPLTRQPLGVKPNESMAQFSHSKGGKMSSAYIIRKTAQNQYYFNLTAENNEKILTSEMYNHKESAMDGIQSVRINSPLDERYIRKTAVDGKPYFVLIAENRETIGKSETYSSRDAMENGITSVKRNGPKAPVVDQS
jgi:uncharacterized protein YegP (UPF0339 family)